VITTWRVTSFDEAVPLRSLQLVLDSDDPRVRELVEQAAHAWGVEIERVETRFECDVDESGGLASER
jgi:hypothetical protein